LISFTIWRKLERVLGGRIKGAEGEKEKVKAEEEDEGNG
jgi:hypothetical protein